MKTLHKFVVKSYLGPFVFTFLISLFILLMQFLWKYIDDLVGKGLEWTIIAKLLFYVSATLIPMALPLAILLSSIMTFGNLGENYELVALKSSGLSLQRIMLPLTILSIFLSVTAFYFSNNVLPKVNLKMYRLLYDVRESKPAFKIKEGTFYSGIEGYSMRVGKKGKDGKSIEQILIYDHTSFNGNNTVLYADSGKMEMSNDKQFLIVTLYRGHRYEEVLNTRENKITHPLVRDIFKEHIINFDMTGFKLILTDEELFKNNYQMFDINQLQDSINSMRIKSRRKKEEFYNQTSKNYYARINSFNSTVDTIIKRDSKKDFLSAYTPTEQYSIIETASNIARSAKAYTETIARDIENNDSLIDKHLIEWHKKFTLSFACLVLFFIGAPLGAIIRKGGMGMPVVVSIVFYIFFHVISITGEKSAREGVIPPYAGMWLASAILLPIGIFLSYKASTDSSLFDIDIYVRPIKKLFGRKFVKKADELQEYIND